MAKTTILSGGFGSGKSEIAIHLALKYFAGNPKVVLADLDLVNPYFVIRDQAEFLNNLGLKLLAPSGKMSHTDLPSIPGSMIGIFSTEADMVIDLAGDEAGATVLGYLSRYVLQRESYDLILTVNPYRPFAENQHELGEMISYLEQKARMKFTSIISNPNLLSDTDLDTIIAGHEKVVSYAEHFQLPIIGLAVKTEFYQSLYPRFGELLIPLKLYLRPDYLQ